MSDPIDFETLLRDSLATAGPPRLTPAFTERVTTQLRPRRLSAEGRRALSLYGLAAAIVSIAVMRSQGVEWSAIAVSLAITAALGALVRPRPR